MVQVCVIPADKTSICARTLERLIGQGRECAHRVRRTRIGLGASPPCLRGLLDTDLQRKVNFFDFEGSPKTAKPDSARQPRRNPTNLCIFQSSSAGFVRKSRCELRLPSVQRARPGAVFVRGPPTLIPPQYGVDRTYSDQRDAPKSKGNFWWSSPSPPPSLSPSSSRSGGSDGPIFTFIA